MAFERILRRTRDQNILFSVLVELTYRCNLNCYFCYNDRDLMGTPMETDEYVRLFEDLRDLQAMNLVLSGGEPLAHPDFMLLGRKARELGFVIRLKSNGHALRRDIALQIKEEIAPFVVELSIHGACPETHERQTRVPGSFHRLMTNLRDMIDVGLRMKLNCTLTAWNENELEEIFGLADSLGIRLQVSPEVTPLDNSDRTIVSISASREGLQRLYRLQADRAEAGGKRTVEVELQEDEDIPESPGKQCGAGSSGIAVDPFGNVYPCVQWRRPVGNLHHHSIKEIWTTSPVLGEVRSLAAEAKKFVDSLGPQAGGLAFCPALAMMGTGSPTRMYLSFLERKEIANQVKAERLNLSRGGRNFSKVVA